METRIGVAAGSRRQKWGRIDRLATLYVVQPIQRCVAPYRASHIPILMYHSVSEQESGGWHPYFETTTAPQVFAEHMKFLRESGYQTVTINEAVSQIESGKQVCEPRVVLTFDDGFQDFYTHAFPILEEHQFNATVFLPTKYIAEERRQFKNWHCMTWSEVREMDKRGIKFGSHTVTHQQLRSLEITEVENEVRCSKETIEDQLGHSVESFSYPFAFPQTNQAFKGILKALLMAQGYKNGVTTAIGTVTAINDQYFLPRLPINSWDDLHLFKAKLKGAYDWLYCLQYGAKLGKLKVF